ncbi:MAG: hypothetical protein IJA55_07485 [Clostridia bacterium]|nr:hypothetical protein [Clostridia bacterium]
MCFTSPDANSIWIDIKSNKLNEILKNYEPLFEKVENFFGLGTFKLEEIFTYWTEETAFNTVQLPKNADDALDNLSRIFTELALFSMGEGDEFAVLANEIKAHKTEILADLESIKWSLSVLYYPGSNDDVYDPDCYDEESLETAYNMIIEENGYASKDEITNEDFEALASSRHCFDEDVYVYNRDAGISEIRHTFGLGEF